MTNFLTKKLAIFLIKNNYKTFDSTLKTSLITKYVLKDDIEHEGLVIIGHEKKQEPDWKYLLQTICKMDIPVLNNSSNRAVLFFKTDNRIYAICFGYGKYLLKDECIEREFGLKTALNLIDADKLISIDKANIGDLNLLTKTQASQKGSPYHFEIDILRDLVKGITGEPKKVDNKLFGNIITGNEALHISPKVKLRSIPRILGELNKSYLSDEYKDRFDWIDNIKPEKDPKILEQLKLKLVQAINKREQNSIHLAPPYLIDWESFEYLSYTPKGKQFNEFDIKYFYKYKLEDNFEYEDWEKLTHQNFYIKFSSYQEPLSNKLWRFLNYETELNGFRYIFTSSNWYKISKSYFDEIYEYCSLIPESESNFIDCHKNLIGKYDEGFYNEQLSNSDSNYILFDKNLIKSDVTRSRIELCDVFNKSNNELIHVKFRESSSTLSHLFSQGKVSSNSLQKDKTFRKNIRTFLKADRDIIPLENKDINPNNYTVTYAIIENKNRNFVDSLPFFSLVNFRLTLDDLLSRGFNVRVKKILKK
ncbi:TIGR04141 family sporadically distributed protein [Chryseobacterium sp. SIMBA_029]|uniref:TIGR04141 family sporadically distributed protein n=1 Tax=Chryseobacterium sp. SIMBA_029 TaxID=3085772 RepID=UPI00397A83F5